MKVLTALRILVVVFAVIIIALLWILFFYNPVKIPSGAAPAETNAPVAIVSGDGTLAVATSSLRSDMVVASPLALEGTVTGGGWFFEATFPIEIIAADGRTVLATTTARAEADWASTGTVPWSAVLVFNAPHGSSGYVLFKNDNPSGDPSKEKTLQVPVRFQ